jgi:hypothetical protein
VGEVAVEVPPSPKSHWLERPAGADELLKVTVALGQVKLSAVTKSGIGSVAVTRLAIVKLSLHPAASVTIS